MAPLPQPRQISVRDRLPAFVRCGIAAQVFIGYTADPQEPAHRHDMVEMLLAVSGEGIHEVEGCRHPFVPGCLGIVHYGSAHRILTGTAMDLINIYLDPQRIAPPPLPLNLMAGLPRVLPLHPGLAHRQNRIVQVHVQDPAGMTSILRGLAAETERGDDASPEAMRCWYHLVLTALARQALSEPAPMKGGSTGLRRRLPAIEDLRRELEIDCTRRVDLAFLARRAGMTPTSLCRAFRRHTGCSISEFLIQRRIELAMLHLTTSREPVAAIALACGFNDLSHFHRSFRAVSGTTPRSWRTGNLAG